MSEPEENSRQGTGLGSTGFGLKTQFCSYCLGFPWLKNKKAREREREGGREREKKKKKKRRKRR